jgi:hypothetical protein
MAEDTAIFGKQQCRATDNDERDMKALPNHILVNAYAPGEGIMVSLMLSVHNTCPVVRPCLLCAPHNFSSGVNDRRMKTGLHTFLASASYRWVPPRSCASAASRQVPLLVMPCDTDISLHAFVQQHDVPTMLTVSAGRACRGRQASPGGLRGTDATQSAGIQGPCLHQLHAWHRCGGCLLCQLIDQAG